MFLFYIQPCKLTVTPRDPHKIRPTSHHATSPIKAVDLFDDNSGIIIANMFGLFIYWNFNQNSSIQDFQGMTPEYYSYIRNARNNSSTL